MQASPGAGMGIESLESCNCTFYMLDFAELAATAGVAEYALHSLGGGRGLHVLAAPCEPYFSGNHMLAQLYVLPGSTQLRRPCPEDLLSGYLLPKCAL